MSSPDKRRAKTPRRFKAGALLALGCALSLAAAAPALAAPMTTRYAPDDQARDVYFAKSVPGKFRNAIARAATTWKKLPDVARFEVHKSPTMTISENPCDRENGVPIGGIIRRGLPGSGTLAVNVSCVNTDTGALVGFRQAYETHKKFYTGKGNPPRTQYDLQGVATHELGHSQGWTGDHYENRNKSKLCANRAKQGTMCPVIYSGTTRQRTLAKDDKKPVVAAYSKGSPLALGALAMEPPAAEASSSRVAPYRAGVRGCVASALLVHLGRQGNTFEGGPGRQRVNLGRGRDIALGKGGDDCVVGGAGDDDLRPGPGNDTVIGGAGADIIVGGPGSDLILGLSGADQIYAEDGTFDRIRCGSELDSVFTADPVDVLLDCEGSDFTEIPLPPLYES